MILSTAFALVMMAVIPGTFVSIAREGWYTPNAIFVYVLCGTFLLSGALHPHELSDLLWGVLYFVCIPGGYVFLIIYSVCNLHVVSWGTREKKTANEQQQEWEEGGPADPVSASVHLQHAARSLRRRMEDEERGRQRNANRYGASCVCVPMLLCSLGAREICENKRQTFHFCYFHLDFTDRRQQNTRRTESAECTVKSTVRLS